MDENLVLDWAIYNQPDLIKLPEEERISIRKRIQSCTDELAGLKKYLRNGDGCLEIDYIRFCQIEAICAERGYSFPDLINEILKNITDDEIREIMFNIDMTPYNKIY